MEKRERRYFLWAMAYSVTFSAKRKRGKGRRSKSMIKVKGSSQEQFEWTYKPQLQRTKADRGTSGGRNSDPPSATFIRWINGTVDGNGLPGIGCEDVAAGRGRFVVVCRYPCQFGSHVSGLSSQT